MWFGFSKELLGLRNGWVGRRSASGGGSRVSQMLRWTRRQERKCARNRTQLPVTTAADQTVAAPESGKPPLPRKPCRASSTLLPENLHPRLPSLLRPEFTSLNQGEPQRQASQTHGTRRQKATISFRTAPGRPALPLWCGWGRLRCQWLKKMKANPRHLKPKESGLG